MAVFSRARWCFRQCAWPATRHARKNHWRARENIAVEVGGELTWIHLLNGKPTGLDRLSGG